MLDVPVPAGIGPAAPPDVTFGPVDGQRPACNVQTMSPTTSTMPSVAIRPVQPGDQSELARFYAALSDDSRYARFLSTTRGITDGAAVTFCGPDHEHREGLVATYAGPEGSDRIVGHLCLDPVGDGTFEMAVAVADIWRGQGIGRRLLDDAIDWARQHAIARLRATMLATNAPVIALIRSTGCRVVLCEPDGGVIEASIEIGSPVIAAA